MDLRKAIEKTKPLAISFDDDKLNVTYRPNALLARDVFEPVTTEAAFAEQVCRLVASWDLVLDGTPVEITPAGVGAVPAPVLQTVLQAVVADTQGPPTPGLS